MDAYATPTIQRRSSNGIREAERELHGGCKLSLPTLINIQSVDVVLSIDASPVRSRPFSRRYHPRAPSSSVDREIQKTNYCCTMDTGREASIDWWAYWRVHVVERDCVQFRDCYGRAYLPSGPGTSVADSGIGALRSNTGRSDFSGLVAHT